MTKSFNITVHGKTLRVVLLDSVKEVRLKWERMFGKAFLNEEQASAFWVPPANNKQEKSLGAIYLPGSHPRITDFVIHECAHAAVAQARILGAMDLDNSAEEHIAILTGTLSARVLTRLRKPS